MTRLVFLLHLLPALLPVSAGAVDVYFSPGMDCENHVVDAITGAKKEIHAALYTINSPRIVLALVMAQTRGVAVKILTDGHEALKASSSIANLRNAGVDVRTHAYGALEHNAFGVFDQELAINGSFNWTEAASNANSENCAVMPEKNAIAAFEKRFQELWRRRGAAADVLVGARPGSL